MIVVAWNQRPVVLLVVVLDRFELVVVVVGLVGQVGDKELAYYLGVLYHSVHPQLQAAVIV